MACPHSIPPMFLSVLLLTSMIGCTGSDGEPGAPGPQGPAGPSGMSRLVIQNLSADPAVLRPNQSASLSVSASDGSGGSLVYLWSATSGTFSSASTNPTTWTAPDDVGSHLVSITVSNGTSTVTGYASILVSVSPGGPVITSVSPPEARIGDRLVITGAGFGAVKGASTLLVGNASAPVRYWADTRIEATVPADVANGSVAALVSGVRSSPGSFALLWTAWNPLNVAITNDTDIQHMPQIASDSAGGAIIAWGDERGSSWGNPIAIYAQRMNAAGVPQWPFGGIAITAATVEPSQPNVVSLAPDEAGGAIIVWMDARNNTTHPDIYAQRVNAGGVPQWAAGGVAISTAAASQGPFTVVADGAGGVIIVWKDSRNGTADVYAQRVDPSGTVLWTTDGLAVATGSGTQESAQAVSDGVGGAIITWHDNSSGNYDVYAQRVSAAGALLWSGGVAVAAAAGNDDSPRIVKDGAGGAIIAWSNNAGIMAQRVNAEGMLQWPPAGVPLSTVAGFDPQVAPDGAGGAVISWHQILSGEDANIYAQRVSSTGIPLWTSGGLPVTTAAHAQWYAVLIPDGTGGAIIAWEDYRNSLLPLYDTDPDVYAQRISGAGISEWTDGGVPVSAAPGGQYRPVMVSNDAGGAILTWQDVARSGPGGSSDIFAQGISSAGRQ